MRDPYATVGRRASFFTFSRRFTFPSHHPNLESPVIVVDTCGMRHETKGVEIHDPFLPVQLRRIWPLLFSVSSSSSPSPSSLLCWKEGGLSCLVCKQVVTSVYFVGVEKGESRVVVVTVVGHEKQGRIAAVRSSVKGWLCHVEGRQSHFYCTGPDSCTFL